MNLLWSNLSLGGLYTDANADDDADADDNNDNDTRRTEHDCIGSLPNEPKTTAKIQPSIKVSNFNRQIPHTVCFVKMGFKPVWHQI